MENERHLDRDINREKKSPLRFLFPYLKPYRKHLIFGPLAKMVEAILELFMPLFMAYVIDQAMFRQGDMGFFIRAGIILLLIVLVSVLFSFTCQYLAATASQGVGTLVRQALFQKIQNLSYRQLDHLGTNTLTNRLGPDVVHIQYAVAMFIRLFFRAPFLALGGSIMAFTISPRIAFLLVLSIILAALILMVIVKKSVPEIRFAQTGTDKLGRLISDHFSGVRIIRAFNRSEHERKYFQGSNTKVNQHLERAARISAFMNPGTVVVVNLAIIIALYWGQQLVGSGVVLPGEMIALISYFTQVLLAMTVTANLVLAVPRTLSAMERLEEVLSQEEDLELLDKPIYSENKACILELKNLSYAYDTEARPVLNKIDLEIYPGSFIGIIGSTGSGKSSLARIMQRLYDPQEGIVFLQGRDIRSYSRQVISKTIGYVPQKIELLQGTIRSNLTLGLEEKVSDEKLWQALEIAQGQEFVMQLEDGLDHKVERSGRNFSGGQRQRLTIARAILRSPEILIMDDSMSALDYKTERQLMENLQKYYRNKTLIFISQRIHTLQQAKRILVLEEGCLVGEGTHEELLANNPIYQEIQASQLTREEERDG